MIKRNLLTLTLVFAAGILFMPANASAFQVFGFTNLYTTDSFGSTTPQDIFNPEETPYLYMSLAIPDGAVANTISAWNDPDSLAYFSSSALSTDTERWVELSNWADVQTSGKWTINANYFDSLGNNAIASADFNVVPEPTTMSLLLLGGIPMLLKRKRKQTKNI